MVVEQLKLGSMDNYTYLIGCEVTKESGVIDPAADPERIVAEAESRDWHIRSIINTHGHGDHTAGNRRLSALTGAKVHIHSADAHRVENADVLLEDGDIIRVGEIELRVIHTPGHTPGGICLLAQGQLFTGDTLFVDWCGHTDFPGGDIDAMRASMQRLMELPGETVVWPGHDYGPVPKSTLGREKQKNRDAKRLGFQAEE